MSEVEKLVDDLIEVVIYSSGSYIGPTGPEYYKAQAKKKKAALLAYVAKVEGERNELKRQSLAPAVAAVCLKPSYAELQQQLAAKDADLAALVRHLMNAVSLLTIATRDGGAFGNAVQEEELPGLRDAIAKAALNRKSGDTDGTE